jgi:hypothetical protein
MGYCIIPLHWCHELYVCLLVILLTSTFYKCKVYYLIKKEVDYDPPSLDDDPPLSDEPESGNSLGASELLQPLLIRLKGGAIAWSVIRL